MNKKIVITIALLIYPFIQNLSAQKVSNEKERKLVSEMIYALNTDFFDSKKQKFKTIT